MGNHSPLALYRQSRARAPPKSDTLPDQARRPREARVRWGARVAAWR